MMRGERVASNSPDYYLCIILCNSDSGLIHYAYLRSGHDLCNTHTTGHHLLSESILYLSVVLMRQTATGDLVDQQRKLGSALCVVAAEAHTMDASWRCGHWQFELRKV